MTLTLVMSVVALVLAIIYSVMTRTSTPSILLGAAVILLALVHVIGGRLIAG